MFKSITTKAFLILCIISANMLIPFALPVTSQSINSSDFTVRAIIPENQIDKGQSYFDLLVKPGQSQTLGVDVINNSNEEIIVDSVIRAASTNRNGLIEYQVRVDPDDTLLIPLDTIAKAPGEIKVAPGGTQRANIQITLPERQFDGVILGGIVFTRRTNNAEASGVSINNKFSYVVGVKLSENDKEIQPDFRIKSIEPTLVNYRRAISVNIHNPVPLIIKNANISVNIYRDNDAVPTFSINKNGADMAPNSVYPLPIEWGGKTMTPEEYRLNMKLTHDGKVWEWDQTFSVDAEMIQAVNNEALDKPLKTGLWTAWYGWTLLIIIILLLLWIAFLLRRRKKDDGEEKAT